MVKPRRRPLALAQERATSSGRCGAASEPQRTELRAGLGSLRAGRPAIIPLAKEVEDWASFTPSGPLGERAQRQSSRFRRKRGTYVAGITGAMLKLKC